ncbi:MAG: maleylacetoacetate isomerase [Maritimibacter sp.]
MTLKLHNYFRSSTSTRLRAALNLKGLDYEYLSYALLKKETQTSDFLSKNPAGLVPVLELEDGSALVQSLAIMEWLDEAHPTPALLPTDPIARARVRALAYMIGCDIHPLGNLRVLQYIDAEFGAGDAGKAKWFRHWVETTFAPLERMLAADPATGLYCHGDRPGFADCCLYAQVWNNKRFDVDMAPYPVIARIFAALDTLPAFKDAAPGAQPDAF